MPRISKKFALLLVLAMLASMFVGMGTVSAADPVKVSSAYSAVTASDNTDVGTFTVIPGDLNPFCSGATPDVLYVTIELPTDVEWTAAPVAGDLAVTTVAGAGIAVSASKTSATYTITPGAAETVTKLVFNSPNVKLNSGYSGDLALTVTMQNTSGGLTTWSQSATPVIAKVGTGELTATAATAKGYGSVPQSNVAGANVTIKENRNDVLVIGETVSLTIQNSGVTFNTAPAPAAGVGGLTFGAGVISADKKTATWTVTADSAGVGGKVEFTYTLDMAPNVATGDLTIQASSSNSKLKDTDLVVANVGTSEFKIQGRDLDNKNAFLGRINQAIGDVELDPSSSFKAGSVEFTLVGAKWNAEPNIADLTGFAGAWTAGTRYGDNRSLWYNAVSDVNTVKFSLPTIDVDANATPGDIVVKISGSAGCTGECVIGQYVTEITVTADKPQVVADALDQKAGDIKITEAQKKGFTANGNLKLTLPNGMYFSKNPKVWVNGTEKTSIAPQAGSGKGYNAIEWANGDLATFNDAKIETIEVKDVYFDVDSRFVSKDIEVEVSGLVLTAAGGSTKTIATVANATGVSAKSGKGSFVIGSTTYTANGVAKTMTVAPYVKDGRTFLPIAYVADALAIPSQNIVWDGINQTVTLMKGDKVVQVKVGSTTLLINGAAISMTVAPEINSGRTMLPIAPICAAFGASVAWDPATQTVTITY